MKRNMNKIIDNVNVPNNYDMTLIEVKELIDATGSSTDEKYHLIRKCFKYGFALGRRCEKAAGRRCNA